MSTVSAILAARDEEDHVAETVGSLAAQPEVSEILVVNDQSTDGTAQVLAELAARLPRLRVLETRELPRGWVGKTNALHLGVAAARGEWLLFTDADVTHLPGSLARALATAAERGAALVSYSPEQETPTAWERAVLPFIFCRLARRFPFDKVCDPASDAAAANGQYLLMRRSAYAAVGGHAAVRDELLEDVALARRAKQQGLRLHFAPGPGIARTRMYRTFGAMWRGWRKNLYRLIGGRPAAVLRELGMAVPWPGLVLLALGTRSAALLGAGTVVLLFSHARYLAALRRIGMPGARVLYYLPGALLYAGLVLASFAGYARGRVSWKGREYRVELR